MRALLPALLLALALAGCTGNTQDTIAPQPQDTGNAPASGTATSTQTPPTTASGTSTGSGPRAAKTFEVGIQGNAFVGGTLSIQKGDTVHWVHKDGTTPHSVASDDGKFSSDGGVACPGAGCMTALAHSTYDFTFGEMGTFPYHCEVHPSMTGVITVVQSQPA